MDQKGLEIVFFTKNAFFCGNFLCGTYAFVGNNSEFLGGSPTISATLAIAFTFFNGSQHHCLKKAGVTINLLLFHNTTVPISI